MCKMCSIDDDDDDDDNRRRDYAAMLRPRSRIYCHCVAANKRPSVRVSMLDVERVHRIYAKHIRDANARAHKVNEDHESCMGGYLVVCVCMVRASVRVSCVCRSVRASTHADNFENTEFSNGWTQTNRIVWHNFFTPLDTDQMCDAGAAALR